MSSLVEAKIIKPYSIDPHYNTDRLDILTVGGPGGYQCIIGRNQFTKDDLVLYLEPDLILSQKIMKELEKSKISMKDTRLRAIKFCGVVSDG
jgi:hypothetical protein